MDKKVRATLLIEVVTEFHNNLDGANDEETVRCLVEQILRNHGYDIQKCELLDTNRALKLEQMKRVDEAELNYQIEIAKLNELMRLR